MNRFLYIKSVVTCFLLFFVMFNTFSAQDKELLSEAIRNVIDTRGIEVAKKHFAEIYHLKNDIYTVDIKGITKLSSSYSQSGNIKAAGAVMAIAQPFMQDMIMSKFGGQSKKMMEKYSKKKRAEKAKRAKVHKENQLAQKKKMAVSRGKARNDLKRFAGLYGDSAAKNKNRKLWVSVSCDGYLVAGADWGDVAPWWMKSIGNKVFTYSDSFAKFRMEFDTDSNGKATRMNHSLKFIKSPLKRLGPLPSDWAPCIKRQER